MSLLTRAKDDEFVGTVHVYEPHSVGLPRLGSYFTALWRRRQFAFEMSRTNLRGQHFNTAFGMLWLVLNPLLLGLTYALLVFVIRGGSHEPGYLPRLMGALFVYHFFMQSVMKAAASVTGGTRLLMNSSFPRLLLPISAVITGVMKFLPTLAVYAVIHVVGGVETNLNLLWAIPLFAITVVFTTGLSMLFATLQVYFRDFRNFLPYMLRIWLYTSPVLWSVDKIDHLPEGLQPIGRLNPLYNMIGGWSQALSGHRPDTGMFVAGSAWAAGALVVGALYFMSREREFAVRL